MATILRVPASEISDSSSMDTIATWDSLAHMNLVLAIEEEFDVSIPDDEAANVTSFKLLVLVLDELTMGR